MPESLFDSASFRRLPMPEKNLFDSSARNLLIAIEIRFLPCGLRATSRTLCRGDYWPRESKNRLFSGLMQNCEVRKNPREPL